MRTLVIVTLLTLVGLLALFLLRGDSANAGLVVERAAQQAGSEESPGALAAPLQRRAEGTSAERTTRAPVGQSETTIGPPLSTSPQEAMLAVNIEDREGGGPLVGVPVFLDLGEALLQSVVLPGEIGGVGVAVLTDEGGTARLRVPLGEKLRLFARGSCFTLGSDELAEPLAMTARSLDPFAAGEQRQEFLFVGSVDAKLHLRIVDREHAQPIRGAEVLRGERVCATSDGSGVALYDLCEGAYDAIEVRAVGYGPALLSLVLRREGEQAPFVVELERGATLRGRVLGLQDPSSHEVQVAVTGLDLSRLESFPPGPLPGKDWTARLDQQGAFELSDLPPDLPLLVRLRADGGRFRALQTELLQIGPGEVREVEWNPSERGSLRGQIMNGAGEGLPNRTILAVAGENRNGSVVRLANGGMQRIRSDASGAFAFLDLQPGPYIVSLHSWRSSAGEEHYVCPDLVVTVAAGEHITDVRLDARNDLFLRGRVLGPDGTGEHYVTISAQGEPGSVAYGVSAEDGSFDIGPLLPGAHILAVQTSPMGPHAAPPEMTVIAPANGIEVQLLPGATLAGRVIDARTNKPMIADTSIQQAWRASAMGITNLDTSGGFRYSGRRAGRYHLIATTDDGRMGVLRDVSVEAGEAREDLEISVGPTGELRVVYSGPERGVLLRVRIDDIVLLDRTFVRAEALRCSVPVGMVTVEATRAEPGGNPGVREVYAAREVEVRIGSLIDVVLE